MPARRGFRVSARRLGHRAVIVGAVLAVLVTTAPVAPALAEPGPSWSGSPPLSTEASSPSAPALAHGTAPFPTEVRAAGETDRWGDPSYWFDGPERNTAESGLNRVTRWLTSALALTGALAGSAIVAWTILWWPVRRRTRPRVAIKPLAVSGTGPLTGEHLATLLGSELSSSTGGGTSVRRVSDAAAETGVDVVKALGGTWAWLTPILAKLSLRKVLVVCGDVWGIAPPEGAGTDPKTAVSLTVSVTDHRGRVASRSFTDERCGIPVTDLIQAQVPLAGAWLTDRLQRSRATKRKRGAAWFGTTEWWSWGRFRQGVWYGDHGRRADAEACYREAITADVRNAAAWLNLAALKLVETDQMEHAIELVEMADIVRQPHRSAWRRWTASRTGSAAPSPWPSEAAPRDPLWYRVRTVEVVARLNLAALFDQEQRTGAAVEQRRRASALALQLVTELARMQRFFEHPRRGRRRRERLEDLHQLLDASEDHAVAFLAAASWTPGSRLTPDPSPQLKRPRSLETLEGWRPRHPRRRSDATTREPGRVEADEVLQLLAGLRLDPRVEGPYRWPHEAISPRAHYNLACLYARASTDDPSLAGTAIEHLRRGLADAPTRADWAREDPELEPLRTDPATWRRFQAVLDGDEADLPPVRAAAVRSGSVTSSTGGRSPAVSTG
jgi:tetratricopeptide (TPR) repeat protein